MSRTGEAKLGEGSHLSLAAVREANPNVLPISDKQRDHYSPDRADLITRAFTRRVECLVQIAEEYLPDAAAEAELPADIRVRLAGSLCWLDETVVATWFSKLLNLVEERMQAEQAWSEDGRRADRDAADVKQDELTRTAKAALKSNDQAFVAVRADDLTPRR